ncbi:MAG: ATP-dependent 6-phosphofructokinase [Desulfarculaceae bacterium]|nr:ATP-dependent 6-phosphofructokinase [Desulfarculaceae bacterium]MCF8073319.1 ATP-dependent 6-phosphofructokinase [Desulfarculaceae bacterium]MCF8103245.1 ATP-dependent 6-phosphofructokinase [Desulfarculaceae bacterium]MCF8116629.1 ATP-dependent 6-phosphofructokinase [Desulfarculaceae bacterium]
MRIEPHTVKASQTKIPTLGAAKIPNPATSMCGPDSSVCTFMDENDRVLVSPYLKDVIGKKSPPTFELAGPHPNVYFDPTKLKAAIVTCGGMCPGINSLVRSIVLQLYYIYGVRNIVGVRFGLQGFSPRFGHQMLELTPELVQNIHGRGGSFLGMSRGPQPMEEVVDSLERSNIGLLFMIGGDGTLRAAQAIHHEISKRKIKLGVVAIPKSIDNDICFVERTFGFETAVEAATRSILGAHNEATGLPGGVGLVKLMGRLSGFVAAHATLALTEVNFCLIPEVPFDLEGEQGLLAHMEKRLAHRGHAVIVVAEGAGQNLFDDQDLGHDASGNPVLGDIGLYLRERIKGYFVKKGIEINLKYIDPSYTIRSVPASSDDRVFTGFLGHHAVHAGMSGRTGMLVSIWNNHFVHVPIPLAVDHRRRVDPQGDLWRAVREATGQESLINQADK